MELASIDLHLLVALDALHQCHSVTRAAEAVGVSQSTMSYTLARLREAFSDPLFVRIGDAMQPTPLALQLAVPVRRMLGILRNDVLRRLPFSPATSERTFTINMSDIAELVFLPIMLRRFTKVAPFVNIRSVNLDADALHKALDNGEVDLAMGYYPDLRPAHVYQQKLSAQSFVCMVRKGHPRVQRQITLAQFVQESHALVRNAGRTQEMFEGVLAQQGVRRRVVLDIGHFTSVPFVIAQSDLVVTVPAVVGEIYSTLGSLALIPPPIPTPSFDVMQHWHELLHHDPGHQWLRSEIARLFNLRGKPRHIAGDAAAAGVAASATA